MISWSVLLSGGIILWAGVLIGAVLKAVSDSKVTGAVFPEQISGGEIKINDEGHPALVLKSQAVDYDMAVLFTDENLDSLGQVVAEAFDSGEIEEDEHILEIPMVGGGEDNG